MSAKRVDAPHETDELARVVNGAVGGVGDLVARRAGEVEGGRTGGQRAKRVPKADVEGEDALVEAPLDTPVVGADFSVSLLETILARRDHEARGVDPHSLPGRQVLRPKLALELLEAPNRKVEDLHR